MVRGRGGRVLPGHGGYDRGRRVSFSFDPLPGFGGHRGSQLNRLNASTILSTLQLK